MCHPVEQLETLKSHLFCAAAIAEVDDDAELDEDRHGEEEADQQPHVDRLLVGTSLNENVTQPGGD